MRARAVASILAAILLAGCTGMGATPVTKAGGGSRAPGSYSGPQPERPAGPVRPAMVRYLKALRAAHTLSDTQAFREVASPAWQLVHNVANHSPAVLRNRYLHLLKHCAGQRLDRVEPLVSSDRERRVRLRTKSASGRTVCSGTLSLLWHDGRWWITQEKWRQQRRQ